MVENQKEGLQSRKKLAEQTKEFKKLPEEEKLREFRVLMKAYQFEIDGITKRTKHAETCFLTLYRLLAEAPDPAPLIATLVEQSKQQTQLTTLQHENKRIKEELSEAERELATIRNSEGSVALLKTRLSKYEAKLEEMVAERVSAKEVEIKQMMDEKIRVYKETEYSLQRQLNQAKDQLVSLQSTHDKSQARFVDHSRQYDEEVAVKLAELDIVMGDLERELLKRELAGFRGDGASGSYQDPALLSRKVKAQDAEITKLLNEAENYRNQLSEKEATLSRRIIELEREAAVKNLETAQMKEELARYEDYEQVKKELHVMKLIEFATSSADAMDTDGDLLESSGDPNVDYSLEKLLMEKNKRFQGENTALKLSLDETKAKLEQKTKELERVKEKAETQSALITKLEEDVYKLNNLVALSSGHQNGGPKSPTNVPKSGVDDPILSITTPSPAVALGISSSDMTSISNSNAVQPISPGAASPPTLISPTSPAQIDNSNVPSSNSSSIVPILVSQRDRYRQRNTELEEESRTLHQTVSELRSNLESLQSDNVKLYEKLRYAESFQTSSGNSSYPPYSVDDKRDNHVIQVSNESRPSRRGTPSARSIPSSDSFSSRNITTTSSDDVTSRYRSIYDANLDPFQRFNKQEEQRRVNNLNPAERGLLTLTRLLAGNRYTRLFFAGYSVMLHVLVMATLYMLSQWEECRHDHGPPPGSPLSPAKLKELQ
ncbi:hypothetical protein HDU97_008058 [Phlyctochytrium planicorne]|nr:hypothetical protein HDU97_008058 [Phlyctochytrium planicorne]